MTAPARHPLIPPREVDPRQELPALELEVLERWRERDVFAESLRRREGAKQWIFYEGPPTANGPPGSHHVLSRVFKDIYPRFQTMRGYRVERKGGWDCHGLPVEIAVEQELGIHHKSEIEEYGIAQFNAKCRESVFRFLEDWNRLTERIGFWIDLEHAYRTLDESYIESVWWALAQIDARGLLYEGRKVVPYCPRCETTLSSHEVALGYKDVVDPSVFLKLPVMNGEERLLVWTTTPWTLPGNVALAVSPTATYVKARVNDDYLVLAEARVEPVLGDGVQIVERFSGVELVKRYGSYRGPIFAATDRERGPLPIVADEFVTTEDGTGIVHLAPAFGEDDYRVAAASPLVPFDPTRADTLYNPVRPDGTYDARVRSRDGESYEDRFVKDPALTAELIDDLRARGLLLRVEDYEHSYPHCWRCGTPLLYYAKPSWYIATSRLRDELLAGNETVNWHPPHVKHGRFGDWLKNNVDWALSRERYWGTPLPVWRCARGHVHVVGSFAELAERSGAELSDHHRPYVDDASFPCPHAAEDGSGECGEPMRRVPEVIDVWFDSGAMPFAQQHFPFENDRADAANLVGAGRSSIGGLAPPADRAGVTGLAPPAEGTFEANFPADFICEAQDQTRGWFYSLLAISTLMSWGAPYRNVVCLGLILDEEGQKMSKSKGNTVEPWQVLDTYGADAFRWYFFTSKQPWDGYRFSADTIGEGVRLFLKQLWSTYYFYVLYAHASASELSDAAESAPSRGPDAGSGEGPDAGPGDGPDASSDDSPDAGSSEGPDADLDRWALSRTAATAQLVTERLDAYDATTAGRAIASLVDELSNWYVRRSRRRFWDGDVAAFETLRTCLLTIAKLLAPFCPFVADEIYDNLDGELASVHLCDFPSAAELAPRDEQLEQAMALARETVRLGLGARGQAKIKVRQPLGEAVVVADDRERSAIERLTDVVREELNVRSVRFVAAAEELGSYEVKANYRTLGPLFGKEMPLVADAIAALDPAHVAAAVRNGGQIGIAVAGREHTLSPDDVILTMRAPDGYSVEREGAHAVALDLAIDDDLRREGRAREIVHAVQNARKSAGLQVEDRIELGLDGDPALLDAAHTHLDYLTGETLALELDLGAVGNATAGMDYSEETEIDGLPLTISLSRAKPL
ncbi:MAG TPA: class I tRNA ligase family protein [Solirubrobacteraceae bacterium]|nr:class I tRNA ligase family protein [Solirubrobacteraceae bacterium]